MALKNVAGTAYVKLDGGQLALKGGLTIDPTTVTREPMVGQDGPHGFKTMPKMPSIAVTLTKGEELSLVALNRITDSTVTAEVADGTVYVLSEAFQSGDMEYSGEEGTVTVTFHGRSITEL